MSVQIQGIVEIWPKSLIWLPLFGRSVIRKKKFRKVSSLRGKWKYIGKIEKNHCWAIKKIRFKKLLCSLKRFKTREFFFSFFFCENFREICRNLLIEFLVWKINFPIKSVNRDFIIIWTGLTKEFVAGLTRKKVRKNRSLRKFYWFLGTKRTRRPKKMFLTAVWRIGFSLFRPHLDVTLLISFWTVFGFLLFSQWFFCRKSHLFWESFNLNCSNPVGWIVPSRKIGWLRLELKIQWRNVSLKLVFLHTFFF